MKISQNNFNSIKVQLELTKTFYLQIFTKFQFHKGTIRTEVQTKILRTELISIP